MRYEWFYLNFIDRAQKSILIMAQKIVNLTAQERTNLKDSEKILKYLKKMKRPTAILIAHNKLHKNKE